MASGGAGEGSGRPSGGGEPPQADCGKECCPTADGGGPHGGDPAGETLSGGKCISPDREPHKAGAATSPTGEAPDGGTCIPPKGEGSWEDGGIQGRADAGREDKGEDAGAPAIAGAHGTPPNGEGK